ncbi:hypothetical protein QQ045_004526 [Rhodiola kirilowii]
MMKNYKIGLWCILEPKSSPRELILLTRKLGYPNYLNCFPTNTHIWIMWNEEYKVSVVNVSDQQVTVKVLNNEDDTGIHYSFVYSFHDNYLKQRLWDELGALSPQMTDSWLIMGDFNCIAAWNEKKGGNKKNGKIIRLFNEFMANVGVSDAGYEGPTFTWSNNQEGTRRIWERLDRCLVNGTALNRFPTLKIHHLSRVASNHCPLLINFEDGQARRARTFKFMGMWTEHDDFLKTVSCAWEGREHINPMVNFALKLKKARKVLKAWNWDTFGDINKKIKEANNHLSLLEKQLQDGWDDETNSKIKEINQELNDLLRYQFGMLEEKAKVSWYKDGDRNSSFFHAAIKARRAHNTIKLAMEDGNISDDGDFIGLKASHYFENLFGEYPVPGDLQLGDLIQPAISDDDNMRLTSSPEMEEIKDSVFSMKSDSSPGPDGFTGKFFTSCWNIIKEDLKEAILGFFTGLQLPKIISSTSIVLIPKVKRASSLDQVRPISLCNFLHKIISKILNSRLSDLLTKLISPEQSGFIEGRNIHDSIGLAHDMVRDINVKTFGGNIMLKIDMSKAYDRISWRFIIKMLSAWGFSNKWIDLVYRNISNCWYSMIWNGSSYGFFKSNRGVRQGDPLSPTLFILAMEFLSRLINTSIQKNTITPYKVEGFKAHVHHLMYADDLLIFSNGHLKSVEMLMKIINNFCDLSGEKMNPSKSKIFFSKHIGMDRRKRILMGTKFLEGTFPMNYLGAPLFLGRARIAYFKTLEDNIRGRIMGWTKSFLNISGRATLINSVLSSLSIYTMSIIHVPINCIKSMERLLAKFIWDGKHHWVAWESICLPKQECGLGLKNMKGVKEALLAKVAWKILSNESLLAKFCREKYLNKKKKSAIWSATLPLIKRLRRETYWAIGRGTMLIKHLCEWLNFTPPKVAGQWTIRELMTDQIKRAKFLDWCPAVINGILPQIQISDFPDRLFWRATSNGKFSVKAFYEYRRKNLLKSKSFENIWQAWIPPKISGFMWKMLHYGLPTDEAIIKLGIPISSKCRCCKEANIKTTSHLFFHSDVANNTWMFISRLFNKKAPTGLVQFKREWLEKFDSKDFFQCLGLLMACCTFWEIWNFRNCTMFDSRHPNIKGNLLKWASSLAPMIKAKYKRSLSNKITLDTLQIKEPSYVSKGSWLRWIPGASGLSLSIAINNDIIAGIIRDCKGTFQMAATHDVVEDDIFEAITGLLERLDNRGFTVDYIYISHQDMLFLHTDVYLCHWDKFIYWRKAKQKTVHCLVAEIHPSSNQPAIALSFAKLPDTTRIFRRVKEFPKTVQISLAADYLRLPAWCRSDNIHKASCNCFDAHICLNCSLSGDDDAQGNLPQRSPHNYAGNLF